MPDIGQIKGTNIKRGNSGLDPKTFDVNKELLDAMRIIARQEIDRASRDITKNALVRSVNNDGTVNITLEGKEFNKIPNYTVGTVKESDVVKVTYPQNQASNMYVSGTKDIYINSPVYSATFNLGKDWDGTLIRTGYINVLQAGFYLFGIFFHICGANNMGNSFRPSLRVKGQGLPNYPPFTIPITQTWDTYYSAYWLVGNLSVGSYQYEIEGNLNGNKTSDQYGSSGSVFLIKIGGYNINFSKS